MKQKQNIIEFSLANHQFLITPNRIKSNQIIDGLFHLEFQKGCQRIEQLKEKLKFKDTKDYIFIEGESIKVKAYKQKNMNFNWSMYKYLKQNIEFYEKFKCNLKSEYQSYIGEIRKYSNQYSNLLKLKDTNRESMIRGWKMMKNRLKMYKFTKLLQSESKNIIMECFVQIKNDLDILVQIQAQNQKIRNRRILQIKFEKMQDQSTARSLSSYRIDRNNSRESLRPKEFKQNDPEDKSEGIMILPLSQRIEKNWAALSDIIEASNQESHQQGDKTDRSDRKPQQLRLTQTTPQYNFSKTKTYHFINEEVAQSRFFRRNNSLESLILLNQKGDLIQKKQHAKYQKNEESQTTVNKSNIEDKCKKQLSEKIQHSNWKYSLLILIIFLIYGLVIKLMLSDCRENINIEDSFKSKEDKIYRIKSNRIKN